jgi:glycosyltransferase involved in cell wall biosynthesis
MTESNSINRKTGISCIVPARNESGHLIEVVRGIISLNTVSEVIIVEGGSSDDTWEVAKEIEAGSEFNIRVMKQGGVGKFNAVLDAAKKAKFSHVMIWDADGTVSLEDTRKLIEYFLNHPSSDVTIGNRLLGVIHPGAMQRANWFGNWWPILGLRRPADLLCGTKIFPAEIFGKIPDWLNKLDPYGDFAILATCRRFEFKIHSVPVDYFARTYGSTNIKRWSGGMKLFLTTFVAFLWITKARFTKENISNSNQSYMQQLRKQRENSSKPALQAYLKSIYARVKKDLLIDGEYLELGAGAGISKDFLGEYKIHRTEYMETQDSDIQGDVDAHALPFKNEAFDGVFLFDTFHHFKTPLVALDECIRVTKPGGVIILIEPYVSYLSYPVYKIFHFEQTTWSYKFKLSEDVKKAPENGDQGISKALTRILKKSKYREEDLKISGWKASLLTPFSFFLTGGTSSPINIPVGVIKLFIEFEKFLPKFILKLIAARICIVIYK